MVVKIIFWLFIVAAGIRLSLIMVADYQGVRIPLSRQMYSP